MAERDGKKIAQFDLSQLKARMLHERPNRAPIHDKDENGARQTRQGHDPDHQLLHENVTLVGHKVGSKAVGLLAEVVRLVEELVGGLVLVHVAVREEEVRVPVHTEHRRPRGPLQPRRRAGRQWQKGVHQFREQGGRRPHRHGAGGDFVSKPGLDLEPVRGVRGAPTVKGVTGDYGECRVVQGRFESKRFHLVRLKVGRQLGYEREPTEEGSGEDGTPEETGMRLVEIIQTDGMSDGGGATTFVHLETAADLAAAR